MNKTAKQLERYTKGVSNHWRIEILDVIAKNRDITVAGITEALKGNEKTISQHTKVLSQSGLVNKKYHGREVLHTLSPYGKKLYQFLSSFE